MEMLAIAVILIFVLTYNSVISTTQFFEEGNKYLNFLREKDFDFLVKVKYGEGANPDKLFQMRVRNMIVIIFGLSILYLSSLTVATFGVIIAISMAVFKSSYRGLKNYYKARMVNIDLTLPYYLKTLEILIQHHTVPVAIGRSVEDAPEIFRDGLREMIQSINEGDSSIQPYMDFARKYPVRDSMRMMRLLYRLGLGSQDSKKEQILMFSRTVSSLQNKARDQKYMDRLNTMEGKTMIMLGVTGGLTMGLLLMSLVQIM